MISVKIHEYNKIKEQELKNKGLKETDIKILKKIVNLGKKQKKNKILIETYDGFKFTNYVGCIPLKTTCIEILPKIFDESKNWKTKMK